MNSNVRKSDEQRLEFAHQMAALSDADKEWYARVFRAEGYVKPGDVIVFKNAEHAEVRLT